MLEGGNIVHKCVHAYGYIYLPTNMNVFMDFILICFIVLFEHFMF